MVLCGQRLRYVSESYDVQESLTDDESQKLVRSRSFTRPNSILGLRKLLSYGDIRSRTSPPLPSATSEKGSQTTSSQGNTHQDGLDIHGAKTNNGEHNQQIQDPPIISRSLPSRIPSMSLIDAHFCDTEAHGRSISTSPPLSTPFIQYSAPPERSNYSQDTWTTGETKYLGSYSPKSNGYAETNQCNRDTDSTKQDDLLSFLLQKHHPGDKNFISTETERWPTYHYNNAVSLGDSASRPHSSIPAMVSPSSSYRSNVPELFNTLSSNSSGQSVKSSIDLDEDELEEENYQPLYAPSAMAELNLVDLKDNDSGISRKVHELLASSRSRSVITQPIPGQFGTHSSQTDASTVSVFDQVTMDKFEMLVDKQNILKTHVDRLGKLHPEVEDELKILKDIHKQVFNEMDLLLNLMQVQCKMPRATIQDLETNEKHYTAEPLDFNKKILDMQFNDTLVKQEKTQHDYWEHHARELSFRFEN
ncbi:hypothetical protein CLU79DRAFT_751840 [Phycomyces nitens]|nr:hypothetical protein CLU79DRAFT_751840 [Phycomyces nitens]